VIEDAREQRRGERGIRHRTATWVAWSLCGLSLALTALSLLLLTLNLSRLNVGVFDYWVEDTTIAALCSTVGAVIASRRPENPIGWIFCAAGLHGGVSHFSSEYAVYTLLAEPRSFPGGEALAWVRSWIWVPYLGLFTFLGLLFPDGQLPSSRWRWIAWLSATVILSGTALVAFSPGPVYGLHPIQNPLGIESLKGVVDPVKASLYALLSIAAISLFVRLRRARRIERQQLKWVTYTAAVAVSGAILAYLVGEAVHASWVSWVGLILTMSGIVGIPITMTIAILKYRLYDIDLIINRTLVYGTLTATLVALYFGSVIVLQRAFVVLTSQESTLAVAASTLAIYVLFNPLRRRIQSFIDRRFYRRKYDARKTLEVFSAKLRDETDLDALSDELVEVVRETMQPAHVSLWLRPGPDKVTERTSGG
jgi:hypothetical protein